MWVILQVSEALTTSALLKLPMNWSKRQKLDRVEQLLQQLELSHVASSLIGDEAAGIKGISGGEKRRVSVGIELVKDPAIIFLDEPTTGLDSEMAFGVMRVLKTLAASNKMVVCTIHQPNSDITDTFDDWMLLSKGVVLYHGPWSEAVDYFQAHGFPCPMYKNPSDVFMKLASDTSIVKVLAELCNKHTRSPPALADVETGDACPGSNASPKAPSRPFVADIHCKGSQQKESHEVGNALPASSKLESTVVNRQNEAHETVVPSWYQVWVLMLRFFRSWFRTPIMIMAEAANYLILGIFIGLLYLKQSRLLPNAPYDRLSAVFLALTLLAFTPSYTALVVWDVERQLLRRETASNSYTRGAFFIAKSLTTAPMEIVQVAVYAVVIYFLIGFQYDAAKFFIWLITLLLFALTSETLGYICAIVTPDSKVGIVLLTLIMMIVMSFSGYLVRNVPVYFAWINRISYFSFATDALVANEFTGLDFIVDASTGMSIPAMSTIPDATKTGLSVGGNVAVLAGIAAGCRLLAWGLLEAMAWSNRI
eukprot:jgi/Chrzof1/4507/Cz14g16020.t1